MIPPKTVQEILEATRIEEVVGEFVQLRRRGVNLIGLCPFHGEKTPSFNVNPTRNIFKCFGCDKKGDAVTFLREHENFTFEEAIRWLGRKYGVEIQEVERTPEQLAEQQLADSLYIVNDFGLRHFQTQLFDTDEGKSVALAYFRSRGLHDDTIRRFGLGYAPDQRDLLLRTARETGYSLDLIQKTGLCSQDRTRDFFRARVMFTIHNMSGKVIAFAGRTLSSDKSVPKYINSPETEIYVKNKALFGLFQAKNAIRKHDECILVEGYMDVISLHQAGIENAVASSGTSLTEGQLQLIRRNTQRLTILYDGDSAGIKAALRGLDLALEQDLDVRVALLPEGHDPDSYVQQKGPEALRDFLKTEAKDFILFKVNLLLAEIKGDPVKKTALVRDIVGSIARIPDPIKRNVYLKECAAQLDIDEPALHDEINKLISGAVRKKAEQTARAGGAASDPHYSDDGAFPTLPHEPADPDAHDSGRATPKPMLRNDEFQERDIVRLLIQYGDRNLPEGKLLAEYLLTDIGDAFAGFDNPLYGRIAAECREALEKGQILDQQYFTRHERSDVRDLAFDLLTSPWEYSPNWEAMRNLPLQNQPMPEVNFDADMRRALDHFKLRKLMKMCELNQARIQAAANEDDYNGMMRFLQVQQKLIETRNALAQRTGSVILK